VNIYQENLFHTKMMLKEFNLEQYLFGTTARDLLEQEQIDITNKLQSEMKEIFNGRNFSE